MSVPIENTPGSLGKVCRLLADGDVNIEAVDCSAVGEFGVVRFITNNPQACQEILAENGYPVTTADLLEVQLPNQPGQLATLCEKLATAHVNIECCFGITTGPGQPGRVLLRVNNVQAAQRVVQSWAPPMTHATHSPH